MFSHLQQVPTISLSAIRGASSQLNVRGRLFDVTGALKLAGTSDHVYCRAVIMDDSGACMLLTFWNLSEVLHGQVVSMEGRCVVLVSVQSQASREGYTDRNAYCLSFNGGIGSGNGKTRKTETPLSTMAEVAENAAFPKVLPPIESPPPRGTSASLTRTRVTPTVSQSPLHLPRTPPIKRALQRPQDLVRFTCVKCDRGDMPTCGVDGLPHPASCGTCGFLEGPIVPCCPVTGERHFDYTTM